MIMTDENWRTCREITDQIYFQKFHCNETKEENRNSIFSTLGAEKLEILREIIGLDDSGKLNSEAVRNLLRGIKNDETDCRSRIRVDRCIGCYMGMVIGDYAGAPIEFMEAKDASNSVEFTTAQGIRYPSAVKNTFNLEVGQWTDDASMGACMADSLFAFGELSGRDIRCRFWNWWRVGYNNAFLYSLHRSPFQSVGLGGNISKSIRATNGLDYQDVPDFYTAGTQDSGNGGLMRLAPVPVYFSDQLVDIAMERSKQSSQTTHPGALASRCAEFMAFVVHATINMAEPTETDSAHAVAVTASDFLDSVVEIYLREFCDMRTEGNVEMRRLLLSQEPEDSKELSWNWREPFLQVEKCCYLRGHIYNGYPNSRPYYGSYCMDGLAIAMNAFRRGHSFDSTLKIAIDYRGDADSTGSIAGQLAGAFYGISTIDIRLINHALQWDKGENFLRALMLTPFYQRLHLPRTEWFKWQEEPVMPHLRSTGGGLAGGSGSGNGSGSGTGSGGTGRSSIEKTGGSGGRDCGAGGSGVENPRAGSGVIPEGMSGNGAVDNEENQFGLTLLPRSDGMKVGDADMSNPSVVSAVVKRQFEGLPSVPQGRMRPSDPAKHLLSDGAVFSPSHIHDDTLQPKSASNASDCVVQANDLAMCNHVAGPEACDSSAKIDVRACSSDSIAPWDDRASVNAINTSPEDETDASLAIVKMQLKQAGLLDDKALQTLRRSSQNQCRMCDSVCGSMARLNECKGASLVCMSCLDDMYDSYRADVQPTGDELFACPCCEVLIFDYSTTC